MSSVSFKSWLKAFRLRTLPLALAVILLGTFLAIEANAFDGWVFTFCLLTTLCLQVLSNLANDYGDSQHGVDSINRQGPSRAVQSGVISSAQMKRAIYTFIGLSLLFGISLLLVAFYQDVYLLVGFFVIGVLAIFAAIAYTNGKKPYGYAGLGDIAVFIFFGLVGVGGSYFLYTHTFTWDILLPASAMGLLSTGVLNINNIRDIPSDEAAGKISIPVRIGRDKAIIYHWCLLVLALVAVTAYGIIHYENAANLLFLGATPLFISNALMLQKKQSADMVDPLLKQLAISILLFVLLFGAGCIY